MVGFFQILPINVGSISRDVTVLVVGSGTGLGVLGAWVSVRTYLIRLTACGAGGARVPDSRVTMKAGQRLHVDSITIAPHHRSRTYFRGRPLGFRTTLERLNTRPDDHSSR